MEAALRPGFGHRVLQPLGSSELDVPEQHHPVRPPVLSIELGNTAMSMRPERTLLQHGIGRQPWPRVRV